MKFGVSADDDPFVKVKDLITDFISGGVVRGESEILLR